MNNRCNRKNRRKYILKVHIVFVSKYRKKLLKGYIADDVKQKLFDIANSKGYEIIAMETDKAHMHILPGYDTTDRVCDIVKTIKQETTHYLWQKYGNFLSQHYWKKRIFWSDRYFACSIGEVSKEIDFVTEKASQRLYIQVAYFLTDDSVIQREFSTLADIRDNYPKFVVSLDKYNFNRERIAHQNLIDFLLRRDI